ncbi:hypothetical protein ACSQ67_021564 [Phaseolus vulgaris]
MNLDRLLARMWDEMGLVRIYTKPQGQQPDFSDPVVLSADRGGCTAEDFCNHIHRSLVKDVKYVLVWGTSARHYPQHCGLSHNLRDEDVVKKKVRKPTFLLDFCCLTDTSTLFIFSVTYAMLRDCVCDSNHIPMHLLGYLTERRRHH